MSFFSKSIIIKLRKNTYLSLRLLKYKPCRTVFDSELIFKILELMNWMAEGTRKETIDDEDQFCNKQILQSILKSKEVFDQLEGHEMRKARTKSNPFEIIQGVFFLNR